ncbi:MAG TPA: GNAT family N-acetyltransferase [Rhodothermales bacterium]|nr:GNAT family N-acetyltransferase [Rhodothermales bacterium]
MPFRIERITPEHERDEFDCGEPEMNEYLLRFARQNDRKETGRTYVAVRPAGKRVLGYYTLSAGAVAFEHLPPTVRKRIARYPVPVAHLGRLAIDHSVQGQGLGSALLFDALRRVSKVSEEMAIYAVEVRALHDVARTFYVKFGFKPLMNDPLRLYLPIQTARHLGRETEMPL